MRGTIPPSLLPGRKESEEVEVGRPKKYLIGRDLVMSQDTARVSIVDRIRIMGKDPKYQGIRGSYYSGLNLLKIGVHEAKAAIGTRICWCVR